MDIQRLRFAILLPCSFQNCSSSGFQFSMGPGLHSLRTPASAPFCSGPCTDCISGNSGSLSNSSDKALRSIARIEKCIHRSATRTIPNKRAKQLVQIPVRSSKTPNEIGKMNPPKPPIIPTKPPTEPMWSG